MVNAEADHVKHPFGTDAPVVNPEADCTMHPFQQTEEVRIRSMQKLIISSIIGAGSYDFDEEEDYPPLTVQFVDRALDEVRPYLIADGGNVEVVEVEDGIVKLRLQGACGTCASSTATMKMGIERSLMVSPCSPALVISVPFPFYFILFLLLASSVLSASLRPCHKKIGEALVMHVTACRCTSYLKGTLTGCATQTIVAVATAVVHASVQKLSFPRQVL